MVWSRHHERRFGRLTDGTRIGIMTTKREDNGVFSRVGR